MADDDDARLADVVADVALDGSTKDLFRRLLAEALQELIKSELTTSIGAGPHEPTDSRTNQRNGGRGELLSAPAGDVQLRIPEVKVGAFFRPCRCRRDPRSARRRRR